MGAELVFESRLTQHVLRQERAGECAPFLSLRLALTDGPMIYASDAAIINKSVWSMTVRASSPADALRPATAGTLQYVAGKGKPTCMIEVFQSPERFAALLDMFKGGYASEITVVVADLADRSDYSKDWNTALHATIPVESVCFEFPLPQSEA